MAIEIEITIKEEGKEKVFRAEVLLEDNPKKNSIARFNKSVPNAGQSLNPAQSARLERRRQKAVKRQQQQQTRRKVEQKSKSRTKIQPHYQEKYMSGYYDSEGNLYELKERLGSGGEGTVYACDNSNLVAKIYHEPITEDKAEKLRWMAANKNEQLLKVAAWVVDVLRDAPNGKVVGFLMPSVRAKEIHELYSLKSRRIYFSEATWHFLLHTAANVARAFYSLHKNEHIMGDVNHGNCVVLADGRVKLIDCDSYSIKTDKLRYPCEVGVATHLAPELHGANLSEIERLPKHDNFGMAIIIFQLLFLGRHPFAGNFLGAEDKSIEDCIREYRFAYGAGASHRNVAQPPGTLSLEAVSPRIAEFFERAFTTADNRPEPREWIEALEDLADSLEQCPQHPGHLFYEKLAFCPWCEIETQTGIMVFPFVMSGANLKSKEKKVFDIENIETLIGGLDVNSGLPEKLKSCTALTADYRKPSVQIVEQHQRQRRDQIILIGVYFAGLLLATLVVGSGCSFVLGIIALIILYSRFGDTGRIIRTDARERLSKAQQKWFKIESDWARLLSLSNQNENLLKIRECLADYRALKQNQGEPQKLESVESSKIQPEVDDGWQQKLETEIGNLLATLRVGSVRLNKYQRQFQAQAQGLAQELAQSESNVKFLGNNLPIGIILVLITIGTPIFSSVIRSGFAPSPPVSITSEPQGQYNLPVQPPAPKIGVFVPEETVSNREIEKIPVSERSDIVSELIRQSDAALGEKNYKLAESKLKFALRFDDKNIQLFNQFGNLFYAQGKYEKSVAYLNYSKQINNNDEANFYLGMNYLQLKKFAGAKDIFLDLTKGSMQNNASFYNLGSAYLGLGQYKPAIEAFQKALSFEPNDIDSTFQMGICFSKIGDAEQVKNFYLALLEKDSKRAEQFKKAVGKSFDLNPTPPNEVLVR